MGCTWSLSQRWNLIHDYSGETYPGAAYCDADVTLWKSFQLTPYNLQQWQFVIIICSAVLLKTIDFCTRFASQRYSTSYRQLSKEKQNVWANKAASTFHAIIAGLGAMYANLVDDCDGFMASNPVYVVSTFQEVLVSFSLGYFLYDVFTTIGLHDAWIPMFIHHIVALLSLSSALSYQRATYWCMSMLIMELTTPFVNARWLMVTLKLQDSYLYLVNGWLIVIGFLVFRLYTCIIVLWQSYLHWANVKIGEYFLVVSFYTEVPAMLILNLFFTYRVISVSLKTVAEKWAASKVKQKKQE